MSASARDGALEVLVFAIGGRRCGVPASDVHRVVRAVSSVPLPGAPAVVEGVINLRGSVVPVLDLRPGLRLPPKAPEPSDHFVVGWTGGRLVALRVDRALGLSHLEAGAVESPRDFLPGADAAPQIAKLPDGLLLLPDLSAFLSAAELGAVDEALARAGPPEGAT